MVSLAGLRTSITNHMPKKSSFGLGKLGKNALMWAFPAAELFAASKAYGFEYDANGQKQEGTNWNSGNSAMLKAAAKSSAYMLFVPMLLKAFATANPVVGVGAFLAINALGWTKLPEWVEELFPGEEKAVNEACAKAGIAYRAPSTSLFGSLGGEGLTA